MKKLKDWQTRTGTGDAALAELVGVERSTIQRAKRGLHSLNIKTQRAIREVTGGEVTPVDWTEHYETVVTASKQEKADAAAAPEIVGAV